MRGRTPSILVGVLGVAIVCLLLAISPGHLAAQPPNPTKPGVSALSGTGARICRKLLEKCEKENDTHACVGWLAHCDGKG
jgi:hypothetical protein